MPTLDRLDHLCGKPVAAQGVDGRALLEQLGARAEHRAARQRHAQLVRRHLQLLTLRILASDHDLVGAHALDGDHDVAVAIRKESGRAHCERSARLVLGQCHLHHCRPPGAAGSKVDLIHALLHRTERGLLIATPECPHGALVRLELLLNLHEAPVWARPCGRASGTATERAAENVIISANSGRPASKVIR